jgi:hypothetical protein
MKTTITYLLISCCALSSLPGLGLAATPPAAAPVPAAAGAPSAAEQAQLASLGAQSGDLLKQSAGERLIVEGSFNDRPRGWGHGRGYRDDYGYGYGYGAGALLLTVLLVTLVVLTVQ